MQFSFKNDADEAYLFSSSAVFLAKISRSYFLRVRHSRDEFRIVQRHISVCIPVRQTRNKFLARDKKLAISTIQPRHVRESRGSRNKPTKTPRRSGFRTVFVPGITRTEQMLLCCHQLQFVFIPCEKLSQILVTHGLNVHKLVHKYTFSGDRKM